MKSILFAASAVAGLAVAVSPAAAQSRISVGQTVSGAIDARDAELDDGSHYECWVLDAPAGRYVVEYRSEDFDAFVAVGRGRDCSVTESDANDDGFDEGLDSRLVFSTDGGPWFIRANTLDADEFGSYTLSVASGGSAVAVSEDAEDQHQLNVICAAVDTLAYVLTMDEAASADDPSWEAATQRLTLAAYASGRVLGRSEDEVESEISDFGMALIDAGPSLEDLMEVRQDCLDGL